MPLPILKFIVDQLGAWAGCSIYFSIREYQQDVKLAKYKKRFFSTILPLIVIVVLVFSGSRDSENFLFGFAQNLLSDIFLVLLTIYFLPKYLNPPKNYKVSLAKRTVTEIPDDSGKEEIVISLINTGGEVYKREEIYWEIFIPFGVIEESDIVEVCGDSEINDDEILTSMWRFSGVNISPLFIEHKIDILKLKIQSEFLCEDEIGEPFSIYYRFKTINGNFPTIENMTREFLGMGYYSLEKYPKLAKFSISH